MSSELYLAGDIEVEPVRQGTFAARIRVGGVGIPVFYTPISYRTDLAIGKPVEVFDGRYYLSEKWLRSQFAIVKAHIDDTHKNVTCCMALHNFNPLICMAAKLTIA